MSAAERSLIATLSLRVALRLDREAMVMSLMLPAEC